MFLVGRLVRVCSLSMSMQNLYSNIRAHNLCSESKLSRWPVSSLSNKIMATTRGQRFKQLTPQIEIPTRSAHQTFPIRNHESSSHCAFHIHALRLAEQSLEESVTAISPSMPQRQRLSECLEALLPMECAPVISLCLVPTLNQRSLR